MEGSLISRNHILGIGLAVGILFASGTGLAAADTPSPVVPPLCTITVTPAPTPVPVTKDPSGRGPQVPCGKFARGAVPKGAPQTGGGGMAAEVGSWS
jgi:hypothetical protein